MGEEGERKRIQNVSFIRSLPSFTQIYLNINLYRGTRKKDITF
jgi:hypothetical protein